MPASVCVCLQTLTFDLYSCIWYGTMFEFRILVVLRWSTFKCHQRLTACDFHLGLFSLDGHFGGMEFHKHVFFFRNAFGFALPVYGEGYTHVGLLNLDCDGSEMDIANCKTAQWVSPYATTSRCTHKQDATVNCDGRRFCGLSFILSSYTQICTIPDVNYHYNKLKLMSYNIQRRQESQLTPPTMIYVSL